MFYIIIEGIRKDDYIVDESSIVIIINFQHPVYKILYIKRRVYKSYKDYLRTFYSLLTDKDESIVMIGMYKELKKKVGYIDYYNISFSTDRIDNVLLEG